MTPERGSLRRIMRERRRALPPAERIAAAEMLAGRLLALPFAPTHGYVAGYWAMDGEIALHAWQLRLPPGVTYCLPVLHGDGRLRFAPWKPGDPLVPNRYGIAEPDVDEEALLEADSLAMAVAPLVAFDAACRRLGMGGGWYDRSFAFRATRPAPPALVGAAFELQRVEALDDASWDIAPDAICTEQATYFRPTPT